MKTPLIYGVSALLSLALFTGCATIVSGTKQDIRFTSEPSGAEVLVDGAPMGRTPAEFELSTTRSHLVRLELPGYQPYQVELTRKLNGWVFGNIAFGGLIGVIVDASTGAMYGLTPNEVNAQLRPATGSRRRGRMTSNAGDTLYIATVLKADPKWKKIAQLAPR